MLAKIQSIRQGVREKISDALSGADGNKAEKEGSDITQTEDSNDSSKYESTAIRVLEAVRNCFIAQKIAGNIEICVYIYSPLGSSKSSSVSCEITEEDFTVENNPHEDIPESSQNLAAATSATEERSRVENLAIRGSYTGVKTLHRRAQGFAGKLYRKNLTLSESVGVSMPVFGLFDVVITLSASVDALLSSRVEV